MDKNEITQFEKYLQSLHPNVTKSMYEEYVKKSQSKVLKDILASKQMKFFDRINFKVNLFAFAFIFVVMSVYFINQQIVFHNKLNEIDEEIAFVIGTVDSENFEINSEDFTLDWE
jgi:hypothetical protein